MVHVIGKPVDVIKWDFSTIDSMVSYQKQILHSSASFSVNRNSETFCTIDSTLGNRRWFKK